MKPEFLLEKINRSATADARSLLVYKNVAQSLFVKGAGVLIGFLTVPLTLAYININDFGIWMTISFLTSWFSLVDVSFGNSLRNRLVIFFSTGDVQTAQKYVSTLYALSIGVALVLTALFVVIGQHSPWTSWLNIQSSNPEQINGIITYTLISFSAQLVLKPINSILFADQKAAWVSWILLLTNATILTIIYWGARRLDTSLLTIAHIYNLTPIGVLGLVSLYLFRYSYAGIAPRFCHVDFSLSHELVLVGGKFFILQLISVLVFTSGGLFIAYFLGSAQVGPYSIANKYFSVITVLYGIVITPYWSAFTDAYVKHDKVWIQHTLRRLNQVSAGMALLAGLMVLAADTVFGLWIGPEVAIPPELSIALAFYGISFIYLSNYNSLINGTGKIGLLVYASIAGVVVYAALTTVLFRWFEAGPKSVVIAGTIWNLAMLLVCRIEYKKIMYDL